MTWKPAWWLKCYPTKWCHQTNQPSGQLVIWRKTHLGKFWWFRMLANLWGVEQKESSGKLVDNCKSTNCQDSRLIFHFSSSLSAKPSYEDSFLWKKPTLCQLIGLAFPFFYPSPLLCCSSSRDSWKQNIFQEWGCFSSNLDSSLFVVSACRLKSLATNKSVSTLRPTFLNTGRQQHQNRQALAKLWEISTLFNIKWSQFC